MRLSKIMALAMLSLTVSPSFSVIIGEATFTFGDIEEEGEYNSQYPFDGGVWKGRWTNYLHRPLQNWWPTITWYETAMWNETGPWGTWMGSWNRTSMWNETAVWSRWNVDEQVGLRCAIERALRFIDRINATTERLEEEGYGDEVVQIREKLMEANGSLTILMEQLESDEITTEAAAHELATIRLMLGKVMRLLSTVTGKVKAAKAEGFLRHMEGCILGNETFINRFQYNFVKGPTVVSALSDIKDDLLDIRGLLVAGSVQEALDEIDGTVNRIDGELDKLNGRGMSVFFVAVNRLEMKLRVLRASAKWRAYKGEDTSGVEEELQYAEAILEEIKTLLDDGDLEGAEELVEEAERHLENAGEIVRNFKYSFRLGQGHWNWSIWKKKQNEP